MKLPIMMKNAPVHVKLGLLTVALICLVRPPLLVAQVSEQRLADIEKQVQALKQAVDELKKLPPFSTPAPAAAREAELEPDPIAQIRDEGMNHSQVMKTLSYLTDVIGPRLTGSPNLKRANQWTRDTLAAWGLVNAHLEPWGPFGRGWSLKRFSAQIVEPLAFPLIAYPKAWSPGLDRPVTAEVIYLDARNEADLEKYKGKLKGAVVLTGATRELTPHFEPLATRMGDTNLLRLANAGATMMMFDRASPAGPPAGRRGRGAGRGGPPAGPVAGVGGVFMGITGEDAEGGVRLTSVVDNGPAAKAGLKVGDLIQAVDGKSLEDYAQLVTEIRAHKAGDKLNVKLRRAGETREIAVTLADRSSLAAAGGRGGAPGGFMFDSRLLAFARDEGAAVVVSPSPMGDEGTVFVSAVSVPEGGRGGGAGARPWSTNAPAMTPQVAVATEDYNRLVRMLQQGEKLKMAVEMRVQFQADDLMAYDTLAEIPGTDLKDEIVMLGGHIDSWHAGTGATDNGTGVAAAMEAVRLIQAAKLKPRRTIRIGLWSGEEQGLLGSRAYVSDHFGYYTNITSAEGSSGPAAGERRGRGASPGVASGAPGRKLVRLAEYEKLSSYFNLDNGGGKIRGIYLQTNEALRPLFRQWLAPFGDLGAETISLANTAGTDHLSFDAIGLPGFQFIQDPMDYNSRTHHSNEDLYDRVQEADLKQASVILAAFVYNAAMLDHKLARKPAE